MSVRIAESAGFCFGVERAIGIAIGCTDGGRCKVYTDGPLIHNRQMMERLDAMNLTPEDLVVHHRCMKCSDTGFLPNGRMCDCYPKDGKQ